METVTITSITRTPRVSAKTGKPYTSLSLKVQEYGDRFLSGFANKDNAMWKEGDKVEIEIKKVEKDGKEYLNFETPKKEDKVAELLEVIRNAQVTQTLLLQSIMEKLDNKKNAYPVNDRPEPFPDPTEEELNGTL